jgi:hypothetical protein
MLRQRIIPRVLGPVKSAFGPLITNPALETRRQGGSTHTNLQSAIALARCTRPQRDQPASADLLKALGHAPIAQDEGLYCRVR